MVRLVKTLLIPLFTLLLTPYCSNSFAAQIKKIRKKKGIVVISGGRNEGISKGMTICFYDDEKKIACGKVRKVKAKIANVKVKKSKIKKIKKGFSAEIVDSLLARKGSKKKGKTAKSVYEARLLHLPYVLSSTQTSYDLLFYNGDRASPDSGEPLWNSDGPYGSANQSAITMSFGVEFEMKHLGLRVGARYKTFQTYEFDSDFNAFDDFLFVTTTTSATALGFYWDYGFEIFPDISTGLGMDFDNTEISIDATRFNENTNEVLLAHQIRASSGVLSLRVPIRYDGLFFDPIGVTLGCNLILPITQLTSSTGLTSDEGVLPKNSENTLQETEKILNMKANSFAFELALGIHYRF